MARSRLWCAALALVAAISVAGGEPPKAPPAKAAHGTPTGPAPSMRPVAKEPAASAKAARPAARPVQPPSPSTFDVTVLDAGGKPVEGAFVLATASIGAYVGAQLQSDKVRSGITGKDGRARLEKMPKAPWNLAVRARGFAGAHRERVAAAAATVTLERGGTIAGVVLDGGTKAPVAGARVVLDEGPPLPGEWQSQLTRNEAPADAKGAFRLDGVGRQPVRLVARAPGYGPARREGVRAGERIDLFLVPGPTLSGTVRDEAGKPVAAALVRLFGEGWSAPPPVDPTDAEGRFTAGGVEPGEYWVVARGGGQAPGLAKVTLTEREDAAVEVRLGEGGYVTGRVVDEAGRPIAQASLRPETFDAAGLPQLVTDVLAGASGADGTFALGPLPAGAIGFAVAHRAHATGRVTATVAPRRSVDLRDVVLESGLAIRGRVRDREGTGLAGVLLHAEPRGGSAESTADGESDANGDFALSGLSAGAYAVSAQAAGFATARASATAGGEPVEIVVDAGGTVVGRVVDTAGRPVEGALLRGEPAEPESRADRPFLWARTGEDGDGRFTIRDATPATYVLRASAAGSGEASLTAVKVVAGRTTDVGTIALGRGGTVAGVVVDADGQAVPGATVRVDRGSRRRSSDDQTAQTDSSGSFEVRGVPPGRVEVVAGHPAYVAGRVRDVEVDAEKEPTPVRIVLTRGGRIEGHARRRDGRPFEDGRVAVSPAGGHTGFTAEPAPTLPDGSFVLEHVPAGRAIVSLLTRVSSHPSMSASPGMTILAGVASRGVDVREGETASLDIVTREVVVAGRVTRGGQGLPGVVVGVMGGDSMDVSGFMGTSPTALAPLSGPPPLTATTREDGGYELVVFGPGRSYVEMRSSERQDFPGREVDIPDVERYELDLEVGEASVSGVVVDEDSGAPVPEVQVGLREPGPDGAWKAGGATGPDGRFAIAAEPGEYVLTARARSRKAAAMPVTVGPGGLSDLRVEMEAGLDVRGHVLDAAGRPAPDVYVVAFDAEGRRPGAYGRVNTLPDGSFRLGGLDAKPYTLVCGGPGRAGFAMRSGVTPGGDPVTLTLRPGGRVLVRIVGPDGTPVTKDVWPRVAAWDGVPVAAVPEADTRVTDAPGVFELSVPAGSIEIAVGGPKPLGRATARVAAGQTTTVELVVREPPAR